MVTWNATKYLIAEQNCDPNPFEVKMDLHLYIVLLKVVT